MPKFTSRQAKLLAKLVTSFGETFTREVVDIVAAQFHGARPPEISDVLEQLTILRRQLEIKQDPVSVHSVHGRLLRRILVDQRRRAAEEIDGPLRMAMDVKLIRHLRERLRPLETLMDQPWFAATEAVPLPRLTDYMSVRRAEALLAAELTLTERTFDEKFHILEAPDLFYADIAYYRRKCALRDSPLVVAYADIDDFKALNTRYTETRVDLDVLGPLMSAIEAHHFAHGHAYRFGGDEYVLLLPNSEAEMTRRFLIALQQRLQRTQYRGIDERPTLSIGFCSVDRDTMLTDREILAAANRAKDFVKKNDKGGIAHYCGMLFRDEDIRLCAPSRPPVKAEEETADDAVAQAVHSRVDKPQHVAVQEDGGTLSTTYPSATAPSSGAPDSSLTGSPSFAPSDAIVQSAVRSHEEPKPS